MKEFREAFDEFGAAFDEYWEIRTDAAGALDKRIKTWDTVRRDIDKCVELVKGKGDDSPEGTHLRDLTANVEELADSVNSCGVSGPDQGHPLLDPSSDNIVQIKEEIEGDISQIETMRKQK